MYSADDEPPEGNGLFVDVSGVNTAKAMALDEYGNVYVCGTEKRMDPDAPPGRGPQPDVAVTIKYKQKQFLDEDERER